MIEALYCHIPFCHSICPFCAFAVHGDRRALHDPFLEALSREIAFYSRRYEGAAQCIRAVYFGGGTPSILTLSEVEHLLAALRRGFRIAPEAEIAFECNPEDVQPEYLRELQAIGVNRLSLGVQSLDRGTLDALGRGHDARQARQAWECVRREGPANYNVDLMLGAPGVDPGIFLRDVDTVLELRPPHVSLYMLELEPRTRFARNPDIVRWHDSHRDQQAESYLTASDRLQTAGYRHYEVSNFAIPGREGVQNLLVWDGREYLGFGPGAHSHADGMRWQNHRHLPRYLRALDSDTPPVSERELLLPAQRANESLMLSLRRDTGLDVCTWEARHGLAWGDRRHRIAERLIAVGQASWDRRRLALTAAGFLVADAVAERLMVRQPEVSHEPISATAPPSA